MVKAGRRENIIFPQVWRRFERKLKDGSIKKFKVQDVTEDLYEPVMKLMTDVFLKEEPFTMASEILENPAYLQQMLKFWRHSVLSQNLSLVCLEDNDNPKPEIVGVNFLLHVVKGFEFEKGFEEPPKLVRLLQEVDGSFNIFTTYGVDEYLGACGLAVNPKYRGMRIGAEILLSREPMCKEMGLRVTETIFSAVGSQKLAERTGFKTLKEIKYDFLAKKLNMKFPEGFVTMKVMTKIYD